VVAVETETTSTVNPTGRKVEVLKQHAAVRAAFGRVGGVDKGNLTSGAYSLVGEELAEGTPTTIQNAFTQVAVFDHVFDTQTLDGDQVVCLHERRTQLVQHVAPLIGDMFLLALHAQERLASVFATFVCARQLALQNPQPDLVGTIELGVFNLIAFVLHGKTSWLGRC